MKASDKKLKKIECFVPEAKEQIIQSICNEDNLTRAEFIRRLIDRYIEDRELKQNIQYESSR